MRIGQLIECLECAEVNAPSKHGQCATCGSRAIVWLTGELVLAAYQPPQPEQVLCGVDREFLRNMGVMA